MKKKNQGAKKLNNKKLGTRDGTFYKYSCVWDRKTYIVQYFPWFFVYGNESSNTSIRFFFIDTAWQNIATEVHLLDNYITNALK